MKKKKHLVPPTADEWRVSAAISMGLLLDINKVCETAVRSNDKNQYEATLEYVQELVTCAVAQSGDIFDKFHKAFGPK
jgi:hypothetical protein